MNATVNAVRIDELAYGVGMTPRRLAYAARHADRDHRPVIISAGSHTRTLLIPTDQLKSIQSALLRTWLANLPLSPAVHSCKRRGAVSHARCHLNRAYVVANDIVHCFPNVHASAVSAALEERGFAATTASLVARLCTARNELPQGAPTSPMLLNLVLSELDARLAKTASEHNATYTRYADDLVFSSDEELTWVNPIVGRVAADHKLGLNLAKQRSWGPGEPATITGIVLTASLQPEASFVEELTRELLRAQRSGTAIDARRLRSQIAWVQQLNPKLGAILVGRFLRIRSRPVNGSHPQLISGRTPLIPTGQYRSN